ncbi:MAG: GGDEF domain-containing protein [Eubacteriales bacterium]|nr:GGDEF domain-containing protein [Eubacteriales bacterium]
MSIILKWLRTVVFQWMYLGYDRETVLRYQRETDQVNLKTLRRICLLAAGLVFSGGLIFGFAAYDLNRAVLCFSSAAVLLALYFYVRERIDESRPVKGVNALICVVSVITYLIGVFSGTVLGRNELGVLAIWLFLLVQISFDLPPLQNALTVLPCAALFLIVSHATKPLEKWYYDLAYTALSVFVGLFVSRHQTHLALDNIIAKSRLTQANYDLYHTCTTDELTGLGNRRMVFNLYEEILADCAKKGRSVACVVLDIDDYKQFNDTYGHPAGDELLRRIGATLTNYGANRGIDIGRIGGEEFLAVWAEESVPRCEQVAEELRLAIERMSVEHKGASGRGTVTMSVGLCLLPPVKQKGAYYYADKALYRAKDAGKNCCCRYDAASGEYRVLGAAYPAMIS